MTTSIIPSPVLANPGKQARSCNDFRIISDHAVIVLVDKTGSPCGEAIVDTIHLDKILSAGKWRLKRRSHTNYCMRDIRKDGRQATQLLHQFVYQLAHGAIQRGLMIDHVNHDGLDCRAENLRAVTNGENSRNRRKLPTSGVVGVHVPTGRSRGRWRISPWNPATNKQHRERYFRTIESAAEALEEYYETGKLPPLYPGQLELALEIL